MLVSVSMNIEILILVERVWRGVHFVEWEVVLGFEGFWEFFQQDFCFFSSPDLLHLFSPSRNPNIFLSLESKKS